LPNRRYIIDRRLSYRPMTMTFALKEEVL